MTLFKQVNGVKVQLTPEEEQEISDIFDKEEKIREEEQADIIKENIIKEIKEEALILKLGITKEELDLIRNI